MRLYLVQKDFVEILNKGGGKRGMSKIDDQDFVLAGLAPANPTI